MSVTCPEPDGPHGSSFESTCPDDNIGRDGQTRRSKRRETAMLTFAEEVMLLVLDDETGALAPVNAYVLNLTLSGAVLMDLALRSKFETAEDVLKVVDSEPTGEDILDRYLARIAGSEEIRDPRSWVEEIAVEGDWIREKALEMLVDKGILKVVDKKILWVFETRRYPMADNREEREVKLRLLDVLLSDKTPEPRDVVLICLADACSIFPLILSERELEYARERIDAVRQMNLIGQAVSQAVEDLRINIAMAMASSPG